MVNLHERMLPTSAGVEPATSWSPVGRRIQLSHRGREFEWIGLWIRIRATWLGLSFSAIPIPCFLQATNEIPEIYRFFCALSLVRSLFVWCGASSFFQLSNNSLNIRNMRDFNHQMYFFFSKFTVNGKIRSDDYSAIYTWPEALRKHAYSNILKILQSKKENFQIKKIDIFF